jgi:hypothetical protein
MDDTRKEPEGEEVVEAGYSGPFAHLEGDRFDFEARGGMPPPFRIAEALLKARGAVVREVRAAGGPGRHVLNLLIVIFVFGAVYGAIVGLFAGGRQIAYAAAKIPLVLVATTVLCLPTFYVFNSLLGSRLTIGQTTMMLFLLAATVAVLLIAFAPIAWFFTVSTGGPGFMAGFHIAVFAIGLIVGVRWVDEARRYLRHLEGDAASVAGGFYTLWIALYTVVGCQMAYYLRPLISAGPFHTGERGLFLEFFGGW